jgi:hypothetical protein
VLFAYQWNRMLRMAYLRDQSAGPNTPSFYGTWTGHWDGTVLVLEGTDFNADTVLDATGLPHSDALRLTQRLSLVRGGAELEIQTAVADPKTFARNWSTVQRYRRVKNGDVGENTCRPLARATRE